MGAKINNYTHWFTLHTIICLCAHVCIPTNNCADFFLPADSGVASRSWCVYVRIAVAFPTPAHRSAAFDSIWAAASHGNRKHNKYYSNTSASVWQTYTYIQYFMYIYILLMYIYMLVLCALHLLYVFYRT